MCNTRINQGGHDMENVIIDETFGKVIRRKKRAKMMIAPLVLLTAINHSNRKKITVNNFINLDDTAICDSPAEN